MADERGETTAQTVLLLPVLLMCLWIGVHSALLFHSGAVATAVANAVARKASTDPTALHSSLNELAHDVADQLGGQLEHDVVIHREDRNVVVFVSIKGPQIVPMMPTSANRTVVVPIEQFLVEEWRR